MEETNDINRELMLDANAAAGLLEEIFGAEMTASPTECAHCGKEGEIGTLLAFVIVCAGVIVLRYRQPNIARPFRTPFVPLTVSRKNAAIECAPSSSMISSIVASDCSAESHPRSMPW